MASLLVLKGTNSGQRLKLDDELVILGRNPDCQVIIPSNAVSRQHAQICRQNGLWYIEDLGSRNGTFVNNQGVAGRTALKENDRIKICDFLFTFHHDSPPPPPLPSHLRAGAAPATEEEPDEEAPSTLEATVNRVSHQQFLEAQPSERLRALLEVSAALSKSVTSDGLFDKIADVLFQVFRQADRCFVILHDEANDMLVPKVVKGRRPNADVSSRFSKTIVRQCMSGLTSILSEDASSDQKIGLSQSIAEFRIRSVMCVPLATQDGKAVGVIQLDTQDRTKKFTADDLKLLIGVANQASVALENVGLHETAMKREREQRDMAHARKVQLAFLPQDMPKVDGYHFYARYESALMVGGDYYDFVPLPDGRQAVLLGDVAGKGIPAALFMAKLSSDARFSVLTRPTLGDAVAAMNDSICRAGLTDRFVTLAAAILDPRTHEVTLANAGHAAPFLYRRSTGKLEWSHSTDLSGLPLGIVEGLPYEQTTVTLDPGDCLILFTDGVNEAKAVGGQDFEFDGVHRALGDAHDPLNPSQIGERLYKAVKAHAAGCPQSDDIAIVCFGRTALEDGNLVTAELGAVRAAEAASARGLTAPIPKAMINRAE
jgi:serine phosphatase RsbU (regulator of sigma subunit)